MDPHSSHGYQSRGRLSGLVWWVAVRGRDPGPSWPVALLYMASPTGSPHGPVWLPEFSHYICIPASRMWGGRTPCPLHIHMHALSHMRTCTWTHTCAHMQKHARTHSFCLCPQGRMEMGGVFILGATCPAKPGLLCQEGRGEAPGGPAQPRFCPQQSSHVPGWPLATG